MLPNQALTEGARTDLHTIHEYIACDNLDAAERVIEDIFRSINNLANNPNIGRVREDLTKKPVRFLPVKHFMIVYRTDPSFLILRILDGRRNIAAIL